MKTLANPHDKQNTLQRLAKLQPDHKARWGRMSAHLRWGYLHANHHLRQFGV